MGVKTLGVARTRRRQIGQVHIFTTFFHREYDTRGTKRAWHDEEEVRWKRIETKDSRLFGEERRERAMT